MIKTDLVSFTIFGENYYPSKIQKQFDRKIFDSYHDPGQSYKVGFSGPIRIAEIGSATIKLKKSEMTFCDDSDFFSIESDTLYFIKNNYDKIFEGADLESCRLHVGFRYDNQCNFQFSPKFLKYISDLNIPFTMSCFQSFDI